MRTSDLLLRQVKRALAAVFLLGGFAGLLQTALPLYALHVIDSASAGASLETLVLLALLATAALATLACLAAVRSRILVRAALWLDHTLGGHMLANGLRHGQAPEQLAEDAEALARLRTALADRTVLSVLDAPWSLALLAALCLLDVRLGAVTAAAALLLAVLLAQRGAVARLEDKVHAAAARTATWWQSATRMMGTPSLPAGATEQWERLNRAHVAAAYALFRRTSLIGDLARCIRAAGQIALIATGGWLLMRGQVSAGVLAAAVLLHARLLAPLEHLLASLPSVVGAVAAWRRLNELPEDYCEPRSAPYLDRQGVLVASPVRPTAAASPRLRFAGPLALGVCAVLLFFAAGLGTAAYTRIGQLAMVAGAPLFETSLAAVHAPRAGVSTAVHVAPGSLVRKGDVLVTLDTHALDSQIAALRLQVAAARIELEAVGDETAAFGAPTAPLPDRSQLEPLEQRIADLRHDTRQLLERIAVAERELAQSQIRAPVTGRVARVEARADAPVEPGAPLLEISTSDRALLGRLLDPLRHPAPPARRG